ncbi:MAG: hypothetical protein VX899_22080 [Myxococcota bacterium]|nr:hypothetical protein [Myxococcota bacterium]
MLRWKSKEHSKLRSLVATVGSLLMVLLWSLALGRWAPFGLEWSFAIAYLGFFLAWPLVGFALLHVATGKRALGIWAGLTLPALVAFLL